jgi:D-xylose 1-dehydrogenase (NADP+, D-xylono-1,5-lactone-forming)
MTEKIKFGIIGCSNIAKKSVLPAIQSSKNAEISIIGSRSIDKAESYSELFTCEKFGTYQDVLDSKEIDAIYISLPVGLQKEWVSKAAKHGKHVICEKSATDSFESAKEMISICKENQVRLMEGLMFRFHPQHKKVQEIIHQHQLGDIFSFHGRYGFPMPLDSDIRLNHDLGGGVLNDAGCYPVCASRMLFDSEPLQVSCHLFENEKYSVDLKFSGMLIYPKNRIASMHVGYGMSFQSIYDLWGDKGQLHLSRAYNVPPENKTLITLQTNQTSQIEIDAADHFKIMIDTFCSELQGNKIADYTFEEDLLNQARTMEALRVSHKERRIVDISEIT